MIKKRNVIFIFILCFALVGCNFQNISNRNNWAEWYLVVDYDTYMSDDYPYTRTLLKIEGTVTKSEEKLTEPIYGDSYKYYITSVKDNSGHTWLFSHIAEPFGWLPPKTMEMELYNTSLMLEPLEVGENVLIYGYNDKAIDITKNDEPIVQITRLKYKDNMYHCIDRSGSFAVRSFEPSYPEQENTKPEFSDFNFTIDEYANDFNNLANANAFSMIDVNSKISSSDSPGINTFTIPNNHVEEFAAGDLFFFDFNYNEETKNVTSINVTYALGDNWSNLNELKKNVATEGLTLAIMATDSNLTFDEAKTITEQAQIGKAKSGKAITNDGISYYGVPMVDTVGITIRME